MSNSNNPQSGGIGFVGLMTILFIALKLMGYIAWSWWWVLSPLWISVCFFLVVLTVFGVAFLIGTSRSKGK